MNTSITTAQASNKNKQPISLMRLLMLIMVAAERQFHSSRTADFRLSKRKLSLNQTVSTKQRLVRCSQAHHRVIYVHTHSSDRIRRKCSLTQWCLVSDTQPNSSSSRSSTRSLEASNCTLKPLTPSSDNSQVPFKPTTRIEFYKLNNMIAPLYRQSTNREL